MIQMSLFNIVFNRGVVPESWSIDINKGDPKDPDNYRAITC